MKMQTLFYLILIVLFQLSACTTNYSGTVSSNYLSFDSPKELHEYYRYNAENTTPIVQGHRGSVEHDIPESTIASFENVLSKTPAVFEIDPRLTKDSVVVVFHDATLDRTTDAKGKVSDYTWAELQNVRLKNLKGDITNYKIHTLSEILEWAKGKTALILDKKDVPLPMIAKLIREHNANSYVMNMVRSTEEALFYYNEDPDRMFSASIRSSETLEQYIKAGIPTSQMFACIGIHLNDSTEALCTLLRDHGMKALLAAASTYDRLPDAKERAEYYQKIVHAGVSIIESDYPTELAAALKKK